MNADEVEPWLADFFFFPRVFFFGESEREVERERECWKFRAFSWQGDGFAVCLPVIKNRESNALGIRPRFPSIHRRKQTCS